MTDETYYELLGVPRDAAPAAIRKAWRRRTDKAGPGSPEFARLNEAADTLLEPTKRAAYDASLPQEPPLEDRGAAVGETAEGAEGAAAPTRRRGLVAAVAVLAVLALAAAVLAGVLTVKHRNQDQAESARTEAAAAAERALPVVLGYDYRTLAADRRNAEQFLTSSYRKKFAKAFDLLENGADGKPGAAEQTKTVVKASVVGTAVMDADPDRVHVLAYVNQTSRHGDQAPLLFQNRVGVSMVKHGDTWLIDNLDPR